MTLVTQDEAWPWQPDKCNADVWLFGWLASEQIGGPLFQMGPGEHHLVGRTRAQAGQLTFAVTVSPDECRSYERWAIQNPKLARNYMCLFADVENLEALLLPHYFRIFYLPHLGEMPDERREVYGRGIAATIEHFVLNQRPSYLVFYMGSSAWDRVQPEIERLSEPLRLARIQNYEQLAIWRKL